jgi:hypothetical protein
LKTTPSWKQNDNDKQSFTTKSQRNPLKVKEDEKIEEASSLLEKLFVYVSMF